MEARTTPSVGGEPVSADVYAPYLPRLVREWMTDAPTVRARALEATLVSVDLSGFTSLSERLQAKGRRGAEELILLVSATFEGLIGIAEGHGGDVLKFRGDALLVLFHGPSHAWRACNAATDMRWFLGTTGPTQSSVGEVRLEMTTGVHTGECHFWLVGSTHRELVVAGPAASEVVRLESAAAAGDILVGRETAAALDPEWLGAERDGARLLLLDAETTAPFEHVPPPVDGAVELHRFVPEPLRAPLAVAAGEGEHRQVTAAFLKFAGTDGLIAREGLEAVLARLEALGQVVGDAAAELELTWLESDVDEDGGKLYLVGGAPSSTGADEERMLRALRRILDAGIDLPLRAGVNRGPAFAGDIGAASRRTFAVMGDTVNLAARLTARAEPGTILASADVLDRSRTRFETSQQPFLVKGKERPVMAFTVGAIAGLREEQVDRGLPLIGRGPELAALNEALAAARVRQASVVELVGEPGIGKSRLVEELKAAAVGFQQLVARGEPYESSTPYFAFRALLRPLVGITAEQQAAEAGAQLSLWVEGVMPDLAPWLPLLAIPFDAEVPPTPEVDSVDPGLRRDRLHEIVDQFMARVLMMPTLIVIEDAHWVDDASAFLLRHLAGSAVPRPWLLCVTRRPGGATFALGQRGTTLELAPLQEADAAALALAAADELALPPESIEALADRSGGNPFFVRELVAAARAGGSVDVLPETVETLLTARIDTLGPEDRLLLRYASVLGAAFDTDVLAEILAAEGIDAADGGRWEALGEFVDREGESTLRFRHDLVRSAAYGGLSFRRRREMHERVGVALERRAGDALDESAALLSLHFLEAGRHERAWRYAVLAGRRAQAIHANVVAAELYERALAAAEALTELAPAERAAVAESLGDVRELFASYDGAHAAYVQAAELLPDDVSARARLLRKEGVVAERRGGLGDAIGLYDEALALLDGPDAGDEDAESRIELELAQAGIRHRQGRYEESIAWSERALEHAEALGSLQGRAHAYQLLDSASTQLGRGDPVYLERALALYEELGDLIGQSIVLNSFGIAAYYAGRWNEALDWYRRGGEAAQRAGDVVGAARAVNNEAEILSDQGRLEDAEQLLHEALRVWRAARYAVGSALAVSNLGRAAARGLRFAEADELLAEALAGFEAIGAEDFVLETRMRQAERLVLEGLHADALRAAEAALAAGPSPLLAAALERLAGYALLQARRPEEAAPRLARSLELAEEVGAGYETALTLAALGRDDESRAILDRLAVVELPRIPLP